MPPWVTSALDYLPRWLELQVAETQLPGCAFAVAHRGRLVLERAFGVADLETRAALTPKHRFRVASHSKSFTAAGIMRLVETRTLRLDAPVGTYVTGLHDRVAATTLRQLLSHGAGVHRDGRDSGQWDLRRPFLDAAELRADLQTPPTLDVDKRFKYSNHAFGLLGLVIESVTGTAYSTWIRREVIEAAGLSHTRPDMPVSARTPISNGYTARMPFGRRPVGRDLPTGALAPATGFVSTAGDLARFFSQLNPRSDSKLLSVASRRAMTRAHRDIPGLPHGRQYGLGIMRGALGRTAWFGHSGGFPGYLTRTCVLPSFDVAFSVLTNAIDGPSQQWADGAIDILATFARHGAPKGSTRRWTGRWWNAWGACDLVPVGNRVLVARPSLTAPFYGATELTVRGDVGRISQADGFGTFGEPARLVRDKRGRATALWLGGGQFDAHAEDLPETARTSERARLNQTGGLTHHRDMMYRSCKPPPPLDRFIDNFWYWEGTPLPHQKELIMANPLVGLLVKLDEDELRHYDGERFDVLHRSRGIAVSGPCTSHFAIDAVQTKIMGVQFRAGGAYPFFGPSAHVLCNEHVALEDIWGADARRLHYCLVEAPSVDARFRVLFDALVQRLCRPLQRHPAVELALARFDCASDGSRVGAVAAESGLSRRRFIEVFVEEVGFTPKLYLRLQRFKRVLHHVYGARDVDWSEVAYLHGYADQPHFNREFREFSGLTPTQYLARPGQGPGHAVLAESH